MLRTGLCVVTALALGGVPVAAQTDPVPVATATTQRAAINPAYLAMFEAMESGIDRDAFLQKQLDAVVAELTKSDAKFRELSSTIPGFKERFKTALTPYLQRHNENIKPLQIQEMTALMARYLSPAEAQTWATFYASPLGRKLLGVAQNNITFSATASEAAKNSGVNAAAIERDLRRTEQATVQALQGKFSPEEERQMLMLMRKPSYPKLLAMIRELPQVRAQLEMTPMDPALRAEATTAIVELMLEAQGVKADR